MQAAGDLEREEHSLGAKDRRERRAKATRPLGGVGTLSWEGLRVLRLQ